MIPAHYIFHGPLRGELLETDLVTGLIKNQAGVANHTRPSGYLDVLLGNFGKLVPAKNQTTSSLLWRSKFRPGRSRAMLVLFGGSPAPAVSEPVG